MKSNFNFLILGASRGGTSLLMGVLDYHSKLEVLNEFNAYRYLIGRWKKNRGVDNHIDRFVYYCEQKANQHLDKKWGNKITTEHLQVLTARSPTPVSNTSVFDTFFQKKLKSTKKIFILRDGRSCCVSNQ